ncbi:GNAT family protein [Paucibacter sp. APW11]|uniref:GNAT family protein n=1 Tax=Roseateles aquae TaxID=3077235 RepID=A0ABU3P8P8_9BURK|nr:GNAT family protein [Paucibacter sp. APW11]MDT8998949.1 GNAT family protein [Paucibacter sp. APW11]
MTSTPSHALNDGLRVHLRPTMLSDLDYVVSVEQDGANRPFITPWERTQHEGALRFPDSRHFIVELARTPNGDAAFERAGYVILQGCRNPNGSVELKRIVLQPKGLGLGRRCVRLLKQLAFTQLHAHRFWLDVKGLNTRALALYLSEGFVEEGRLRESVRVTGEGADGYDSLIVMSMLDREYQARVALGEELA